MPSDFLEKTLEDIIFENRGIIHTKGLAPFRKNSFRQVILPSGKKMDIITYDIDEGHISIDLYELKKDAINLDAILQAYNYFAEVSTCICGSFKSFDIHIVMVGRRYDPPPLIEKMKLPISVFVYDYELNGISFIKMQSNYTEFRRNEHFSLGLWAFGSSMLCFTNGNQPDVIKFDSEYREYVTEHPDFDVKMKDYRDRYFGKETIVEKIKTEYVVNNNIVKFPVQPSWSEEFAKSIPYDEATVWMDFEEDLSDYEEEDTEQDMADFEPEHDEKSIVDEWDDSPKQNHPILEYLNVGTKEGEQ